ncbi:hypothetical protein [Methylocella sp.]|uniref:hypothetical protein n=1 Tax=Methylocella sp. TaxID=1978226 RepID=UPI0035AEE889
MTYARFYQHGVKAFAEGRGLCANPHRRAMQGTAHDGWKDGWIDACEALERRCLNLGAIDLAPAGRVIRIDRFISARERTQD